MSTIVRAGSDARTLSLAVGHIAGTALPGDEGNVGLAGHRDTFFRRLEGIQPEDEIRAPPKGTVASGIRCWFTYDRGTAPARAGARAR